MLNVDIPGRPAGDLLGDALVRLFDSLNMLFLWIYRFDEYAPYNKDGQVARAAASEARRQGFDSDCDT